jgi:hypothetical protein
MELGLEVKDVVKRRAEERKRKQKESENELLFGRGKRRSAIERARERRLREERAKGGSLRKKFYIGLYSPEERKQLFLHYFGGSDLSTPTATPEEHNDGPLHRLETGVEDPYNGGSWYTQEQLHLMSKTFPQMDVVASLFQSRYSVVGRIPTESQTATAADLYNIRSLTSYFKHLLYEREDLFLKIVPLAVDPEQLEEIYNEIIAAYFLQELVYGYSQVLSLHFFAIVDWFPAQRRAIVPEEGDNPYYYQVIISERLDEDLRDYLLHNPSLGVLRACLFQLYHALETAWHTNGYTHNDCHMGNVLLQRIPENSPLYEKDFLYRRLSSPHWYRVRKEDLHNNLLKLIDFGRNRLYVPSESQHVRPEQGRHVHDRLICFAGGEPYGYPCGEPNRRIDVIIPLLGILSNPRVYWDDLGKEASKEFFTMCERLIDFVEINYVVRRYFDARGSDRFKGISPGQIQAEYEWEGGVRADNFHRCGKIYRLLQVPGVFIYRFWELGTVASDVLEDDFFTPYRTEEILPARQLADEEVLSIRDSHVVVSFLENPVEADLLSASEMELSSGGRGTPSHSRRCRVCHRKSVTHRVGEDEFLCSLACYEFKYLFEGKTVYR